MNIEKSILCYYSSSFVSGQRSHENQFYFFLIELYIF